MTHATRRDELCQCSCHHGQYQPVDADETLYPVIADTEDEARDLLRALGVLT